MIRLGLPSRPKQCSLSSPPTRRAAGGISAQTAIALFLRPVYVEADTAVEVMRSSRTHEPSPFHNLTALYGAREVWVGERHHVAKKDGRKRLVQRAVAASTALSAKRVG